MSQAVGVRVSVGIGEAYFNHFFEGGARYIQPQDGWRCRVGEAVHTDGTVKTALARDVRGYFRIRHYALSTPENKRAAARGGKTTPFFLPSCSGERGGPITFASAHPILDW